MENCWSYKYQLNALQTIRYVGVPSQLSSVRANAGLINLIHRTDKINGMLTGELHAARDCDFRWQDWRYVDGLHRGLALPPTG